MLTVRHTKPPTITYRRSREPRDRIHGVEHASIVVSIGGAHLLLSLLEASCRGYTQVKPDMAYQYWIVRHTYSPTTYIDQ